MQNKPDLCSRCAELTTYDELLRLAQGGRFRHGTLQSMRDRASGPSHCRLCQEISQSMGPKPDGQRITGLRRKGKRPREGLSTQLEIYTEHEGGEVGLPKGLLYLTTDQDDELFHGLGSSHHPVSIVESEQLFAMLRSRIAECRGHPRHRKCQQTEAPQLPSRVIDVDPGTPGVAARIIKTGGEQAEYLCLSYCWGGPQTVVATRSSLTSLEEALPIHDLGRVIQDAIETTRQIGFRYLWVDALCIVQDDPQSIQTEIGQMGRIYKDAFAVIVASGSSASTQPFLYHDRDSGWKEFLEGCQLQIKPPSRPAVNVQLVATKDVTTKKLGQEPLDTRAWALQESMLARRRIVFSTYDVFTECRTEPVLKTVKPSFVKGFFFRNPSPSLLQDFAYASQVGEAWQQILLRYTERQLTNPEDRLNAFQGVADEINTIGSCNIHFGVALAWPITLGWRALTPGPSRSPRAPSWSWGCLDCPVKLVDPNLTALVEVRLIGERRLAIKGAVIYHDIIRDEGDGKFGCVSPDTLADHPSQQGPDTVSMRAYVRLQELKGPPYRVVALMLELTTVNTMLYRKVGIYSGRKFQDGWTKVEELIVE